MRARPCVLRQCSPILSYGLRVPTSVAIVYEVVKKKEAEKRAERVSSTKEAEEPTFADLVRQQWEEKKKALEQERTSRS